MQEGYYIIAQSPTTGDRIRELTLEFDGSGHVPLSDPLLAQQRADSWALRLNTEQHMQITDWVGIIEFKQMGIETLPGFNGFVINTQPTINQ
jgi:hypothetical protein